MHMKRLLFFVTATLALFSACQQREQLDPNGLNGQDDGIQFSVYTPRATKGGVSGTLDNTNIGSIGFGVFAYYTKGEKYDVLAKPEFMYNQRVTKAGTATEWTYEPVKYWPNEYGNAAISDEVDYVTFFAYAPWTEVEPSTGEIIIPSSATPAQIENLQKYNIVSINKNTALGDPIIKYVVDTDPASSVDLLWGVAAENTSGSEYYTPIGGNSVTITAGLPFKDLVKPAKPGTDKISFNLKHALAKVKFTIDYISDAETPDGSSETINKDETRIFVRALTINGIALKGALNLNNTAAGQPCWKDFDGAKDLPLGDITFNDGRRDGKEGDANGLLANEENQRLNPKIVENYAAIESGKFTDTKNPGVTNTPQPLFSGTDGYFFVIPRNDASSPVDVTIEYDVETIDHSLSTTLSDGSTHGISIQNIISKKAILGTGKDFEAGKVYQVNIHLGMTSVKIDATVAEWPSESQQDVNLPDNS